MKSVTFHQRQVQDLAWAIRSPPLISGEMDDVDWWTSAQCEQEYLACHSALCALDKHPEPLLALVQQQPSRRLGTYFETLLTAWLTISPNFELLFRNHPVREQSRTNRTNQTTRTWGEMDFIIRERRTGAIIHLEVALKFYLGHTDLQAMQNWHGPGLKDRLDLKFQHLRQHQTQLARKHPSLLPVQIDRKACLLKGRLFYPDNTAHQAAPINPARFAASDHLYGTWQFAADLAADSDSSATYLALNKQDWLAEIAQKQVDASLLVSLPRQLLEPRCYAHWQDGREQPRLFVLPDQFWPQTIST